MKIYQDSIRIAVIGSSSPNRKEYDMSYSVGVKIAKSESIMVCGGEGGIMEAASKGASDNGGIVIGFLPSLSSSSVNPYVHIPIYTSLGFLRNGLVVANSDKVIAFSGSYGTLSEIVYALQLRKPVFSLGDWELPEVIPIKSLSDVWNKVLHI